MNVEANRSGWRRLPAFFAAASPPESGAAPAAAGLRRCSGRGMSGAGSVCRIAVMLPRFSRYGGVEQFGFRLAEGLARRGHLVDFICARQEADAPQGVRVLEVGRPPGFRSLKMLWFLVRAELLRRRGRYDLSVSLGKTWNQDISRMGGGPLKIFWEKSERALPPGFPRMVKRLGRSFSPSNWLTLLVEKHQFGKQSEVIAVSHLVRDWLLEAHASLAPERVRVVYNRPDSGRFFPPSPEERAAARAALRQAGPAASGVPERAARGLLAAGHAEPAALAVEPVFIGTASTNFRLKGVGPLIRAFALLPEQAVLFVAGGREHGRYTALARQLGLDRRVVFCGKVEDMPSFYKALDIFVLPTFYDACSNAVLEALVSGCKVLTSRSNGAAFFLDAHAVLPDPGDVGELAKRLRALMEQPAPPPFVWPDTALSGMDAFIACIERKLEEKRDGGRRTEEQGGSTRQTG